MKAPMGRNPRKVPHKSNRNRPGGASYLADSLDPRDLLLGMMIGNRETMRLAGRNLKKRLKAEIKAAKAAGVIR